MELHLLAVEPDRRNSGIGAALVDAGLRAAIADSYRQVVLWTQSTMLAAQRLYERAGFVRAPSRDWQRDGRLYLVFERSL